MSFFCKACGCQRAGSPTEGEEVCAECRPTQAGRAYLLLARFERCEIDGDDVLALETVLGEAQNDPPLGEADGSITERRWLVLRDLVAAARNFNAALDKVRPFNITHVDPTCDDFATTKAKVQAMDDETLDRMVLSNPEPKGKPS